MAGEVSLDSSHAWQMTAEVEVFEDSPRLKCNDAAIAVGQGCQVPGN